MGLVKVRCVIVDLSNGDRSELVPESFERDEENTILLVLKITYSLLLVRVNAFPVRVIVRPCALVFSLSPRISQLDEPNLLTVEVEVDSVEKSIGMALHNSRLTCV